LARTLFDTEAAPGSRVEILHVQHGTTTTLQWNLAGKR
jgi:hypothetical protein